MASTPSRIHVLPPELASQVAAGEVVERPASVVKELVENSLDAGAGLVSVEVQDGGSRLIRVRDDGHGIDAADMDIAMQSHATSKIRLVSDLETIRTLGFRGEALPSIAAVSRFTLCSRPHHADQACLISVRDGVVSKPEPAPHPPGTTAEARDLFYNVPARRKFLRADQTELTHVQGVTQLLGLSNPSVAWQLTHNGRQLLDWRAGDQVSRIAALLGKRFVENSRHVEAVAGAMRLHGWFGSTEQKRKQGDRQYLFLNGRIMRDRRLNHAVREGWRSFFADGAHPVYVLFLQLEPESFDINTHPNKYEVRLRDMRATHDFISAALRRALSGAGASLFAAPSPPPSSERPTSGEIRQTLSAYGGMAHHPSSGDTAAVRSILNDIPRAAPAASTGVRPAGIANISGLIGGRLLCIPGPSDLLLIDVRAAWEQILLRRLTEKKDRLTPRPLMMPEKLKVDPKQLKAFNIWRERLADLATEINQAGPDQVSLHSVPVQLDPLQAGVFLAGMAQELLRVPDPKKTQEWMLGCLARQGAEASVMNTSVSEEVLRCKDSLKRSGVWRRLDAAALDKWLKSGK